MTPLDQARNYVKAIPGAVSGSSGHSQTYSVAACLTHGFSLNRSDALSILQEYNLRCSPPWSQRELEHKIDDAISKPHEKQAGHLLSSRTTTRTVGTTQSRPLPVATSPAVKEAVYQPAKNVTLPEPIADGTRLFLRTVFNEGEGISICKAKWEEDHSREVPDGQGVVLSREDWLRRLDAKGGNPNGIMRSADKSGIFIRVNPMKVAGSKDADVTVWRHALIEFDKCSISEQWSIYQQSNIPCSAIILSGGKSVHAWVKVDAKDAAEFAARVKILHEHFAAYGIDSANKNPSRFSRLPGCERFKARQELIALNIGAASWLEWQTAQIGDNLGEIFSIEKMEVFDAKNDKDCILGDRYQSRGGSCLIVGPSGVGKSALSLQMAILWSLKSPAFGIKPHVALKSLFVQAENNFGDMAEMMQGVKRGMKLDEADMVQVRKGIIIRKLSTATGHAFIEKLQRMIALHKPDIVWIDPLLAYIGGDISKQEVCSNFLRNWLNPIAEASGVCFFIAHHTNKPMKDPKAKKGFSNADLQYEGAGSAELVNWSRSVMVLQQVKDGSFCLILAKRGWRAGALDFNLERTLRLKLAHSKTGICWEQLPEEYQKEEESVRGKPAIELDYDGFAQFLIGKGWNSKTAISILAHDFCKVGKSWLRDNWGNEILSRLDSDSKGEKFKVKTW